MVSGHCNSNRLPAYKVYLIAHQFNLELTNTQANAVTAITIHDHYYRLIEHTLIIRLLIRRPLHLSNSTSSFKPGNYCNNI